MFIYSYQQHDHLLPGNDRMLVIGSSALAKNHGHLKSSRLAADTLIFNFPLNHPRPPTTAAPGTPTRKNRASLKPGTPFFARWQAS